MRSLVAGIPVAVFPLPMPVVVEPVPVEWTFFSRSDPVIIMHLFKIRFCIRRHHTTTIRCKRKCFSFRQGTIGITADIPSRFKTQATYHVQFTQLTVMEEFYRCQRICSRSVLKTYLYKDIILLCRLNHFLAFPDGVTRWFFHINMLSRLTAPNGGKRMPVIGHGDGDRVDILIIQNLAYVPFCLGFISMFFFQFFDTAREKIFITITDRMNSDIGNFGKSVNMRSSLAVNTHNCQVDAVIGAKH